jgi:hypothetical protein
LKEDGHEKPLGSPEGMGGTEDVVERVRLGLWMEVQSPQSTVGKGRKQRHLLHPMEGMGGIFFGAFPRVTPPHPSRLLFASAVARKLPPSLRFRLRRGFGETSRRDVMAGPAFAGLRRGKQARQAVTAGLSDAMPLA